ncbi:MAG: penicillin acylase family protein [Pseudomonadota bacterium]
MKNKWVFATLLIALLISVAFTNAFTEGASFRESARLAAERYQARIIRDAYGVPHVYGDRNIDTAFGLAYAQAEDNIHNIEESFTFARGETGRAKGREGAKTDYIVAAMRVRETLEEKYDSEISTEVQAILEAYADGINYFCAEERARCSKGFVPLSGRDVAAAPKTRGPFVFGLGKVLAELFDNPSSGEANASRGIGLTGDEYASYIGVDESIVGSNAVAVSPFRSADGHTRLYSNAHQPFVGPSALYEARVKSNEGWDIYGAFVAGSPFAIFGATPNLAWTITVSQPDLIDVYQLEVDDPDDPKQYKLDGEWLDLDVSKVRIGVKLWGPFKTTVVQKVYRSKHGPAFETPNGWYAISFAGYDDVQSFDQLYAMNTATDKDRWLEAMSKQGVVAFNVVYADKLGNIAFYYNARTPRRSPHWDWRTTAPGNRSDLLWQGVHPFRSVMPFVENPVSGYVVSANHDPFHVTGAQDAPEPGDFPAHLGVVNESSNRGLRIHQLFDHDESISEEELIRYKMDGFYAPDSYLMRLIDELSRDSTIRDSEEFDAAVELLTRWDGNTEVNSREVALATRVGHLLLGIQLNPNKSEPLLQNRVLALRQAMAELQEGFGRIDPRWGDVNRIRRGEIDLPLRGGPDVLRAVYSTDNPKDGPMSAIAGDSLQFLVDWDAHGQMTLKSVYHYGANKGDPASPHYADQVTLFAQEKFRVPPISMESAIAEATADYTVGTRQQ